MRHHFYFDISDGEHVTRDADGLMLHFPSAAPEATRAFARGAREVLPDGLEKAISASVRDEAGTILFRAVLAFRCEWRQGAPRPAPCANARAMHQIPSACHRWTAR